MSPSSPAGTSALRRATLPGSAVRRPLGNVRRGLLRGYERSTAGDRMLPTCIIVGAQKGGTSSLYEYLAAHPDVAHPRYKEIQYFTDNALRPLSWYRAHFPRAGRAPHACESSPYYQFHPGCPARIREALPNVKLILLLRDPVERAYSHYHMNYAALGYEKLDFASALEQEQARLAEVDQERLRDDRRYRSFAHKHFSYVARGMYASQLEAWYEHFPRQQILVAASEELFRDPAAVLHTAQAWLGLSPHTPSELRPFNARSYAPLDPGLRAELKARFAHDVARLRELTDATLPWALGEPAASPGQRHG